MKADIMLIKRNALNINLIDDAIIIENKLSTGTAFTVRQKEGFGAINDGTTSFTVRSLNKGIPPKATIIIKSVIKTGGNGTVSDIYQIKKLF